MKFKDFVKSCNDFLEKHPESGDLWAIVQGGLHFQTADPPRFSEAGFWDGEGCPGDDEIAKIVRI